MRLRRILRGVSLCAALALCGGAETASAITPPPPSVLNSNAASDSGDDYNNAVATDGAGNWVTIWYSEEDLGGTLGTDGDILVSRSSDNGATWTAAAPLHSHFEDDGDSSDTNPKLAPIQGAGNWLVVWRSNDPLTGTFDIGTDNDVLFSRSTDNGATWSAPAPVNNDAATDTSGNTDDGWGTNMATDGAGNVVVTWTSGKNVGGTIGGDHDVIFARSTDNGVSWSNLAALNTNADSDTGEDWVHAPVATDGAGNWVCVWTGSENLESSGASDLDHFVARSSDDGATWTDPQYLHADFKTDLRSTEFRGWLATDGAGTWVAVWTSQEHWGFPIDTDPEVLRSLSTDNGATWTRPYPLSYAWADGDPKDDYSPHVATDRAGTWLATWSGRDQSGGPLGPDTDMLFSRSNDGGVTWTYPAPMNTNAYTDSGGEGVGLGIAQYTATDGAGNWVSVWNSAENLGGTIGTDHDILYTNFALRTVDSTGDAGDFSTADGVCDTDDSAGDGPCTLRAAIEQANANPNLDNIYFDIDAATDSGCNAGTGVCTIQPASVLPTISQPVAIDGYTQDGASANTNPLASGSNAVLKIELDGTNAGAGVDGLTIAAGGSTVKGLVINRFQDDGIRIETNGGNTIEGNFIGTDVGGTADLGNDDRGIHIYEVGDNTIGGSTPPARNLISGNEASGVFIEGGDDNTVAGNYIGTDVSGTADLGNGIRGVYVYLAATGNIIGGSASGEGNVISGNDDDGLIIEGTGTDGNFAKGNFIGVDATGLAALPNTGAAGVSIVDGAQNNTIGGTTTPGSCDTDCNVISGNESDGVRTSDLGTDGNTISGNFIGVDVTGLGALPNGANGVRLNGGSDNVIGGAAAGESNLISGNVQNGVCVDPASGMGNSIRGNAIHSNTFLGIDLSTTAQYCSGTVTPNDAGDGDTGPNDLMNFPVITSAAYDAVNTTISGTLDTGDPTNATVDVYASDAADASGYGEGRVHLGSTTAPGGSWTLVVSGASPYIYLSATATDSSGNTSEFSLVPGTDGDSDGLADLYETNTGVYVSPTNTGSDPADPDSDDDGLDDGEEVNTHSSDPNDTDSDDDGLDDGDEVNVYGTDPILADTDEDGLEDGEEVALGTDPTDPDHDDDTICDGGGTGGGACTAGPDNCPFIANPGQTNSDGLAAGDDCQCGDVNGDLAVDSLDMQIAREKLVGATLSGAFDVARCDFTGAGGTVCEVDDLFVLERLVLGASTPLANACPAYFGP